MQLASTVALVALATSVVAEGFLHFDVEKRAPSTPYPRLRKRATDPIDAQIAQNTKNYQEYLINITVGTPGQQLGVTLDTGSSDLWIPSATFCNSNQCDFGSFDPSKSSTYETVDAGGFNITYAAPGDSDAGDWASDSVTLGGSQAIKNQTFGLSDAGYDVHGVMGIGFDQHETTAPNGERTYPTVVDNMVQNGLINRKAYSLYLNSYNQSYGSIVFGGVDTTKYTGDLVALPLQPGPNDEGTIEFFVTLSKVTFTDAKGASTVLTPDDYAQSVLLDSGTSYTALTNDVIDKLASGMGAVSIDDNYDMAVPCGFANTNATISYTFGGSDGPTVVVPMSETIGTSQENECVFGFGPAIGGISILGDTFLRSAYVVFDIDNAVVAIAQAAENKQATSSIVAIPTGTEIPGVSSTATASGTQLDSSAAEATPTLATASYSGHHTTSILAATPTFDLGAAISGSASSGGYGGQSGSSSNAAVPAMTGLPHAALLGAGLVVGALAL